MAISVSCDECGEEFQVKDEAAGKRVKCRGCGAAVKVPDDEWGAAPAPRRNTRRAATAKPASSGMPGWVIPVAVVGIAGLVVMVGIWMFVRSAKRAVAKLDPANVANQPANPAGAVANPGNPAKPADPTAAFEVPWSAQPDAPTTNHEWPATLTADIELFDTDPIVGFPMRASPFVAVQLGHESRGKARVWNIATKEEKGSLKSATSKCDRGVLSPDGEYLLVDDDDQNKKDVSLTLWSFKTGEQVKLASDVPTKVRIYDFGPPGQAVLWTDEGTMFVVDAATGGIVRRFDVVKPKSFRPALAISPAGRFAALAGATKGVFVFDVTTGKPVGRVKLGGDSTPDADGVAFSPDGKRLACLFEELNKSTLVECDMTNGATEIVFTTPGQVSTWNARGYTYGGAYLHYLADDRGWVLMGDAVIDRKAKDVVWRFPYSKESILASPRGVQASSVLAIDGPRTSRRLKTLSIPWDKIEAALAQTDPSALVFGPGVAVKVDVQLGALVNGGQPEPTKAELEKAIRQLLETRKIPVMPDAPGAAIVKVEYSEKVGPNMRFTSFGVGRPQNTEYPSTLGAAVVTVISGDGARTLFKEALENVDVETGFFQGEMSAARLRESMLKKMQARFHALPIPRVVPKDPNGQSVPGVTQVQ